MQTDAHHDVEGSDDDINAEFRIFRVSAAPGVVWARDRGAVRPDHVVQPMGAGALRRGTTEKYWARIVATTDERQADWETEQAPFGLLELEAR